MDLFHQTISMKSVGNLTDFVREHMLEASPVEERIQALIGHYQDLDRAHELVLKAKEQVGFLTPLVADCDERGSLAAKVDTLARLPRRAAPVVRHTQAEPAGETDRQPGRRRWRSWPIASQRLRKRAAGNWRIATRSGRRSRSTAATASSASSARSPTSARRRKSGRGAPRNTTRAPRRSELPGATDADTFAANQRAIREAADESRSGAGRSAERAHRSRHGTAPAAGAVRRTGSGAAVAVPPAIEHSAADSGDAQRTVPHHRHQRRRHPVRRGTAAGARGRARVGRRHRTAAAQFRPFAAGARRALRAGGGMGGPDASRRTAGLFPRAQGARGGPRVRCPPPRWCASSRSSRSRPSTTGWTPN